jgi:hypothetical protein
MTKIIKAILFIVSLAFVSCANIRKYNDSDFTPITDLNKIEGEYENIPFNSEYRTYATFENVINWRKKKSDSIKFSSVKLKIIDDKLIQFTFTNKAGNIKSITAKYNINENGFVSLKNRNFKLTGLPYIFGGYQINKVELGLTNLNQLIVNGSLIDEGAILIILPAGLPKDNYTYKFQRK